MREGIRLFKIFGIEISLDFSWFIIFLLVTWSLASGYFPFKYPFFAAGTYWIMGAISSLLLFVTVLMHELTHSVVANHNGLNIRGIKLFVFGGVAQLTKEPQSARVEFDIAIAGPICSFVLYFLFKAMACFLSLRLPEGAQNPIVAIFAYLSFINIFLGAINLIPAYPLDGGRVFRSFVWAVTKNFRKATAIASSLGKLFAIFLIFNGFMATIRGEFSGLWYVFIGMFLFSAAKMGYENILIKDALNGVLVRDVMSMHVHTIDTSLTLDKVVEDYVFKYHHSSFPVIEGDKVKGMLVAGLIRNIPRDKWHVTPVSQCLEPIRREQIVSSREKVSNVLGKLLEHEITHLLVMENEKLVGIVTRIDIMKLLKFKMEFGG